MSPTAKDCAARRDASSASACPGGKAGAAAAVDRPDSTATERSSTGKAGRMLSAR